MVFNDMYEFADGVLKDSKRLDELKKDINPKNLTQHNSYISDTSIVEFYTTYSSNDTLYRFKNDENLNYPNLKDGVWSIYLSKEHVKKLFEFTLEKGKINGVCKSWRTNGTLAIERFYTNGKNNGDYKYWDNNGQLINNTNYKQDRITRSIKWNPNGKLLSLTEFIKGQRSKHTDYDSLGKIKETTYYSKDINNSGSEELALIEFDSTGFAKNHYEFSFHEEEQANGDIYGILTQKRINK